MFNILSTVANFRQLPYDVTLREFILDAVLKPIMQCEGS